ncbi:MAG: DUF5683 domain-containing protein [Gemmatimonadota bacterium]
MTIRILALGLVWLAVAATPATAQEAEADTTRPADAAADTTRPERRPSEPLALDSLGIATPDTVPILAPRFRSEGGPDRLAEVPSEDILLKNPRNAAIRAFLIPGWGQFYTGHPFRGIFWAAAETGFFTFGYRKQLDALDLQDELQLAREEFFAMAPDSLKADTLALTEAFDRSPEAITIRAELSEVEERREDWYAYFALSVIFAAVDAYVSAQLDPIQVSQDASGRVSAGVSFPVGRDPARRAARPDPARYRR